MRLQTPKDTNKASTKYLLLAGVAAPILFVAAFLAEGIARSGYSPMRDTVSVLNLTSDGWQQITNFIVTGVLMLLFAAGVRRTFSGGKWKARLIAFVGVGLVISGIFMPDHTRGYPMGTSAGPNLASSWHNSAHGIGALLWIASVTCACFVFGRYFNKRSQHVWALYSWFTGIVVIASFVAFFATSSQVAGFFASNGGLVERIAGVAAMLWVMLLGTYLVRTPASSL